MKILKKDKRKGDREACPIVTQSLKGPEWFLLWHLKPSWPWVEQVGCSSAEGLVIQRRGAGGGACRGGVGGSAGGGGGGGGLGSSGRSWDRGAW